jgi:hypothetical protein
MPYWHYNVSREEQTPTCPEFLLNLSAKDKASLATLETDFKPLTWPEVKDILSKFPLPQNPAPSTQHLNNNSPLSWC